MAVSVTGGAAPVRQRRKLTVFWLLLPGAVWLGLFFIVPFYSLVANSLFKPDGSVLTGYHVGYVFSNFSDAIGRYWPHMVRAFVFAVITTLLCLVLGYVLAYTIAFKTGRWKNFMLVLVVAPFFTSFLIRTQAWKLILSDKGWVVHALQAVHFLSHDGKLLATPVAAIAGLTYNFLPFAILPLYTSIEKIDRRLLEAAGDLYANPVRTFARVTLPLTMPGVIGATLLTFIPAVGDYINVTLLGSPNDRVVGQDIQALFTTTGDYASAGALSVVLMVVVLAMTLFYVRRAGTEELL